MVRKCMICGKLDYSNPNLSFHKFPSDIERRSIWFSILNLSDASNLPQSLFLCSEHFDPKDFAIRGCGKKFLQNDANPILTKHFTSSNSSSSPNEVSPFGTRDLDLSIEADINQRIESLGSTCSPTNTNPVLANQLFKITSSNSSSSTYEVSPFNKSHQDLAIDAEMDHRIESLLSTCSPKSGRANQMESAVGKSEPTVEKLDSSSSTFTEAPSTSKIRRIRKRAYIGDVHTSDFSTPEKRRKTMNVIRTGFQNQKRKIRNLQQSVRRMKQKITTMKSLICYLKEKSLVSESSEASLLASVEPEAASSLFERMLKGPSKQKYNPTLRAFALTLAFYSPKGYNFVRKTFNNSLPHLETISKWYRSVDGTPGFTKEALTALTLRQKEVAYPLLCNLVLDEMSIRRQVEWTGTKFTGYVDIGTKLDSDILPEAREALVFMVVCMNGSWKVPVGYFLLNGLVASEKAELVKKCLCFIHESGIKIMSLTFDGASANFSMAEKLGADFNDPSNLKTKFKHPITEHDIYINPDACHMIKLVRNCFASQNGLRNMNNEELKWSYVSNLVDVQNIEGLHAATKLRQRHLQWMREKMKVRLATQTLSKSVSDALNFLREDLKCLDFQGSKATSEFILNFNNLFDILNSRNTCAKYFFKKPLMASTAEVFMDYMDNMKKYILGLTINEVPITRSGRKTGFLGLLICIESLQQMYKRYVIEEKCLKYILTYKLSQDHLELFFGCIRSKGGYNNNPTARQFEAAYKRLIVHSQIKASNTGNAINLEAVSILTCGSKVSIQASEHADIEKDDEFVATMKNVLADIEKYEYKSSTAWNLTPYAEDIVGYISGYVVRILQKFISCRKCLDIVRNDMDISLIQRRKTYGRLTRASQLVIDICKEGEKFFKFFHKTTNIMNRNVKELLAVLINQTMLNLPSSILDHFKDHLFDGDYIDGHSDELIKMTLKNYFRIRIHHETTKLLDKSRINRSRSINTKTILFRNE